VGLCFGRFKPSLTVGLLPRAKKVGPAFLPVLQPRKHDDFLRPARRPDYSTLPIKVTDTDIDWKILHPFQ